MIAPQCLYASMIPKMTAAITSPKAMNGSAIAMIGTAAAHAATAILMSAATTIGATTIAKAIRTALSASIAHSFCWKKVMIRRGFVASHAMVETGLGNAPARNLAAIWGAPLLVSKSENC